MGCDASGCMAELGNALGVQGVLLGSLTKIGKVVQINARILDPASGQVLASAAERIDDEEQIFEALTRVGGQLRFQFLTALKLPTGDSSAAGVTVSKRGGARRFFPIPLVAGGGLIVAGAACLIFSELSYQRLTTGMRGSLGIGEASGIASNGSVFQLLGATFLTVGAAAAAAGFGLLLFGGRGGVGAGDGGAHTQRRRRRGGLLTRATHIGAAAIALVALPACHDFEAALAQCQLNGICTNDAGAGGAGGGTAGGGPEEAERSAGEAVDRPEVDRPEVERAGWRRRWRQCRWRRRGRGPGAACGTGGGGAGGAGGGGSLVADSGFALAANPATFQVGPGAWMLDVVTAHVPGGKHRHALAVCERAWRRSQSDRGHVRHE